ncbi:hypothetical protein G4O51_01610 [Candidatus Bathyarchaeota archaeon A05DMB-2]|nr:hypothetical protein [Candidatus Bathyarchaeota archaeon A05DMB-2]
MAIAIVIPAVSADTSTKTAGSYYGEGVGAGVAGNPSGGLYYSPAWHSGRWLGSCQSYYGGLYWWFYANGGLIEYGGTIDNTHDRTGGGPYSSIGASASSSFYDSRRGVFTWTTSIAQLP